jgi:hypothetical protein
MADNVTKSDFLARVSQSRSRWDHLVEQVAPEDRQRPGFSGEWSLRDVVAHIQWHEAEMVELLEARTFGGSPYWDLPMDERNARIHEDLRSLDLEAVWSQAHETAKKLTALLRVLPEASLNDPTAFPGMPEDWKPWEVLASNTYEHYDDHAQLVEAWLAQHGRQEPDA